MNRKPTPVARKQTPDAAKKDGGLTRPSRHQQSEPRLPHERDESVDSQQHNHDKRGVQAAKDIKNGLVDTGRGPVVEKIAREHFPSKDRPD